MSKLPCARPATAAALGALAALVLAQSSLAASAPKAAAKAPAPSTASMSDDDKTLYALGLMISRNLETFELTSAEFKTVEAGLADGINHHPGLDVAQYDTKVQALMRTRVASIDEHQKQAGQAYVDKAAALPGAQKTATGMVFIPVSEGNGVTPSRSDRVLVNYEGRLIDGTVFDSSARHGGQPASLSVTGVIPCWTEALLMMKVGGKSRVICPSSLAYGDRGMPPVIMPGSTLEFSIELVDLAAKPTSPAPGVPPPSEPGDHN
jgi:FKBP-type peptidyl-prolyl cis-trans isomerase FkpA